jgi:hypothetical protein
MTRFVAIILCLATAAAGCGAARTQVATPGGSASAADVTLMASYVSQLPTGSRVRVSLADGRVIRGTLMKGDADPIVVQRRTRIPEPPLSIPVRDVRALELDAKNGGAGRAIALGAAAGAASALGVMMLLVAIFAD